MAGPHCPAISFLPLAGGPVCFSLPRAHLPLPTPGGCGLGDGEWCKCKCGRRDGLVEGQSPFLPLCGDPPVPDGASAPNT